MIATLLTTIGMLAAAAQEQADPPPAPPRPPVIAAAEWGSKPLPIPEEHRHTPTRVTLHHAGVMWNAGDDLIQRTRNLQSWGQRDRDWPDLPYHFLIGPDGRILEGRSLEFKGETNTSYDTTGHLLIQCWGSFGQQRITEQQLESAVRLSAHYIGKYDMDPASTVGHNDVADTSCPGADFDRYIDDGTFEQWTRDVLEGRELKIELKEPLEGGPTQMTPTTQPGN